MAADEHALIREVTEPLDRLPYHPLEDVASPNFPAALRGYDRTHVDAYVARVSQLVAELEATRVPEAAIKRALERVGEETSGVLKRAHETADEIIARSRAEAEERLERARAEADEIVREARDSLARLDRDTDRVWAERTKLLEDTKRLADDMLAVAEGGLERFPPEEAEETQATDEQPTQLIDMETVAEHDLAHEPFEGPEPFEEPDTEPVEPPTVD